MFDIQTKLRYFHNNDLADRAKKEIISEFERLNNEIKNYEDGLLEANKWLDRIQERIESLVVENQTLSERNEGYDEYVSGQKTRTLELEAENQLLKSEKEFYKLEGRGFSNNAGFD